MENVSLLFLTNRQQPPLARTRFVLPPQTKTRLAVVFIIYDTILTCYLTREEAGPGTSEDPQGL